MTVLEAGEALDRFLLRLNRPVQYTVIAATVLQMIAVAIPNVPRAYIDYARVPLLNSIHRPETYGTDTIGNSYVAKVVLNDPFDMFTQGASGTDAARESDVDPGGISALSTGGVAHDGGAVCHRGGDGHRVLRHGPAAGRAVRGVVPVVFPEHAVVPLSPPVP